MNSEAFLVRTLKVADLRFCKGSVPAAGEKVFEVGLLCSILMMSSSWCMWPGGFKHLVPFVNETNKQTKPSHSNAWGQRHFPAKLLEGFNLLATCYLKAQASALGTSSLFLFLILEFLIVTWSLVPPYLIFPPAFLPGHLKGESWSQLRDLVFPLGQQALPQSRAHIQGWSCVWTIQRSSFRCGC